ncbi:hypothetical protein niasHT_007855 [Heterodera trifolii]|uniref:G-protein coupled receptors family 1 profile domain-containing protein n=1 Tax=Heterodera trifolii TaxID=157864 RepID=A0ABD2LZ81_9BILA
MDTLRHALASSSLAMVVFGCFGNCLSASVFLRRKTSINILLSALAFVDIGLLLFAIPVFILPTLDRNGFVTFESVQAVIVKFLYPVNLMFQTWSIYTIVLITAERWLAICRPLHVRSLCTSRTAKWSLLFTASFSVLYNVVRFWEYSLNWTSDGQFVFKRNLRDSAEHPLYVLWYYSMLFLFGNSSPPNSDGNTAPPQCSSGAFPIRCHLSLSPFMLLLVTLTFALCNSLPFLLNLAECVKRDLFESERTAQMAYLLNDLANFLVILNSSTSWIFYTTFSAKFREGVATLFGRRVFRTRSSKGSKGGQMTEERFSVSATSNTQNQGF